MRAHTHTQLPIASTCVLRLRALPEPQSRAGEVTTLWNTGRCQRSNSSEFVTKSLAKQWRNKKEIERDEGPSFWDSVDSKQVCPLEKILEKRARENAGAQVTIAKNGDTCTILFDL